ncbi:MAG: cadmium-translocating P-type ATPase [Lentisphaeria bacterium]|nr:cadmium-translocating P-type ATPase [Lentisphaeria bacterium]
MKEKRSFAVSGMHCAGCAAALERAIKALPQVEEVYVNFASGRLSFLSPAGMPDDATVLAAIDDLGFKGSLPPKALTPEKEPDLTTDFRDFFIALGFTVLLLVACFGKIPAEFKWNWVVQVILLIPVLLAGRNFFIRGIPGLIRLTPNMDSLISCGALAGIIYSVILVAANPGGHLYFDTAAMIITLIMLGKTLELRSRRSASAAIRQLLELTPPEAHLLRNGVECDVPVSELLAGDMVRVKPGEKIPADAVVRCGESFVNESMLTGESVPVSKAPGDQITGGTVNVDGSMDVEITSTGEASVLGRIVALISEAQNSRPPAAKLADKVSGFFVWFIFGAAILTAVLWMIFGTGAQALHFSLSVLVVACPCALGLAVPIALISGIGRGAADGILIKNGAALETAAKIRQLIFDKTGTLTAGVPEVKKVVAAGCCEEDEFIRCAAAVEKFSEHPLANAVIAECRKRKLDFEEEIKGFSAIPGRGVRGEINGKVWLFGNRQLMEDNLVMLKEDLDVPAGATLIYGAADGVFAGVIAAGDRLRDEAAEAVRALKKMGIKCFMLTGDNQPAAEAVAKVLDLDGFYAGLLPQEKVQKLKNIRADGGLTGMVGDGINDAPVLAASDLGVAIGSGSDIALESADVVLLSSNLQEVVKMIKLSRMTFRVIRQNLFWAFFYNICGIPLAAGGLAVLCNLMLNPAFCAGAMAASSLTVVLNALRLRRVKLQ